MSIAIVGISSVAVAACSIRLFAAASAFAEQHSRLKLLVGPDKICVKPTQCFTSKPDTGNAKVTVSTSEDRVERWMFELWGRLHLRRGARMRVLTIRGSARRISRLPRNGRQSVIFKI